MRFLRNQDGIALLMALMFTLITLGMVMMLLQFVLTGTKMSGAQARYRNSLEASYGGAEFVTKTIIPRLFSNYTTGKPSLINDFSDPTKLGLQMSGAGGTSSDTIFKAKLTLATAGWGADISRRSVDPKTMPDIIFTLKGPNGANDFKVYSKIVDTVPGIGLIDASGIDYLDAGIGVAGAGSSTQTPRTPNIYSIEVQGEKAVNPKEKAALSVLYAY